MNNDLKFFFSKDVWTDGEIVKVKVLGSDEFSISTGYNTRTKTDYLNQNNILKEVRDYVSMNAKKIHFPKNTSVKQALDIIYKNIGNTKTDEKIRKKTQAMIDDTINLKKAFENTNLYNNIITDLPYYFIPDGIKAIVLGEKYPAKAAMHDFARGVDRKKMIKKIEALPFYLQDRLRKFCTENNFMWDNDTKYKEYRSISENEIKKFYHYANTEKEYNEYVAYAADDLLRDAAKYEYFKKTGNKDIFFSKMQQMEIEAMTDDELAKKYATASRQRFDRAIIIKERIEKLIKQNKTKDITQFIHNVWRSHHDYFCNPDIARMMFDTLKPHFNKFKQSDEINHYFAVMLETFKDAKLEQDISDTLGIDIRVWAKEKTTKEKLKENKTRMKKSLSDAAKRISSGDIVSGVAILEEVEALKKNYGVRTGPDTFNKAKALREPTATQKKIAERFSNYEK